MLKTSYQQLLKDGIASKCSSTKYPFKHVHALFYIFFPDILYGINVFYISKRFEILSESFIFFPFFSTELFYFYCIYDFTPENTLHNHTNTRHFFILIFLQIKISPLTQRKTRFNTLQLSPQQPTIAFSMAFPTTLSHNIV